MRFQKKKTVVLALTLAVVGVLATALPAWAVADTVSSFTPSCGVVGTHVTITGTGFTTGGNSATAVWFNGIGGVQNSILIDSDTRSGPMSPAVAAPGSSRWSTRTATE